MCTYVYIDHVHIIRNVIELPQETENRTVPDELGVLECWALRRLAPGPGNWLRPQDLCHLKCYATPFDFPSFHHLARAAKLRFMQFEPQLRWNTLRSQILDLVHTPVAAISKWRTWYQSSPILNCSAQSKELQSCTSQLLTSALQYGNA